MIQFKEEWTKLVFTNGNSHGHLWFGFSGCKYLIFAFIHFTAQALCAMCV